MHYSYPVLILCLVLRNNKEEKIPLNSIGLPTMSLNFYTGGLSGQTSNFGLCPRAKQCYSCQELADDIAHRYEKPLVCGVCAKKKRSPSSHMHRNDEMRLVACDGPQAGQCLPGGEATKRRALNVLSSFEPVLVSEKDCEKFYPAQHEILAVSFTLRILFWA